MNKFTLDVISIKDILKLLDSPHSLKNNSTNEKSSKKPGKAQSSNKRYIDEKVS